MLRKLAATNNSSAIALVRIVLGVILFPHGAQKLLGWFGGFGFQGTMGFLTGSMHLPYVLALLVIFIEFFGAIFLILGLCTRLVAFGVICLFIGIIVTANGANGFFMNWAGTQKGEGIEFDLLVLGIALALLINGAGGWSLDRMIGHRTDQGRMNALR